VYATVFLFGTIWPDVVLPASGLTNLIVALVAFFVWKPDDLRDLFFRSPRRGRPGPGSSAR
jgi:hypothetical protein